VVGGIFTKCCSGPGPSPSPPSWFLARPTTARPAILGDFDYLPNPHEGSYLHDHCNGLLLLLNLVEVHYRVEYLVYDPAVSPHFEVISVPRIFHKADRDKLDPSIEESEWPTRSECVLVGDRAMGGEALSPGRQGCRDHC